MTLILSGTDGLSDVDGSAATPAIRGTDANTGIFFPAADTIAFSEGGAEAMRIDSSGNVGIGISPNASSKLQVKAATNSNVAVWDSSGTPMLLGLTDAGASQSLRIAGNPLTFTGNGGGGAEAMRIDSSGNVGIGTSSITKKLTVYQNQNGIRLAHDFTTADYAELSFSSIGVAGNGASIRSYRTSLSYNGNEGDLRFYTNTGAAGASSDGSEAARIDSSGNLLVGCTTLSFGSDPGIKLMPSATTAGMAITVNTATAAAGSYHLYNTNATNNGYRFYVVANGGIYNFSGNNSNLSDERTKTNVGLSGDYLTKICAIPVKLFNYKDEPENEQRTLGVIAQDVELVAPELVNNEGFGETPEGEAPLKSVYTTDMMFALMKCIQELKALVDTQASTITTLTDRITALETPTGTQA